jgi:hypothetical protein
MMDKNNKTATVRLKITAPAWWNIPVIRLKRRRKGFINTQVLRSIGALADKQFGRTGG